MDNAELLDNQVEIVPASPEPSQMANEALAAFVRDGMKKLAKMIPYVKELKARFAALPRGKADIMGCHTWKQFCENVLDHTDSAVRKAISAQSKGKEPRKPTVLLSALKRLKEAVPTEVSDGAVYKHVRFQGTDDGKVLLSAGHPGMQLHITLDVPAPKPDFLGLAVKGPEDEKLFLQIMDLVEKGCPGMPPWGFLVRFEKLLESCQEYDGDPCITYRGPGQPVEIEESEDGQLRFHYLPSLDDFKALLPYTGNFLPDLKPGDDVFVHQAKRVNILTVRQVIGAKIVTDSGTFDREGPASDQSIVRLATDEDRQVVAAQKAKEQEEQEAEQRVKADAQAEKENAIREEQRLCDALLVAANLQVSRIPQGIWRSVSLAFRDSGKVALSLNVTIEQLERIVEVMNLPGNGLQIIDEIAEDPDDLRPVEDAAQMVKS